MVQTAAVGDHLIVRIFSGRSFEKSLDLSSILSKAYRDDSVNCVPRWSAKMKDSGRVAYQYDLHRYARPV